MFTGAVSQREKTKNQQTNKQTKTLENNIDTQRKENR